MSNTKIQVKRSTTTNQPAGGTLLAGEVAYSYSSNVFFVGSSGGNDVLAIGGKYFVDKTNTAYDTAIAAYTAANSGAFAAAAFDKANSANYFAYLVNANTVAAYNFANTVQTLAIAAYNNANSKFSSSGGTINGDVNISGNLSITR
jgi:uncharacterized membrane protein YgdD (TMEM256/DUF423 family)